MVDDRVKITISIRREVNKKLRELAYRKYGFRKGAISQVLEEIIEDYYEKYFQGKKSYRDKE